MLYCSIRAVCILATFSACLVFANEPTPVEQFYVADGLEATVWAEAPMLFNPANMGTDTRGRIWVSEAVNYRAFRNEKEVNLWRKGGDRIMVLEDTDRDGKADSSHVFVQDSDLVAPLGLSVLDNRVIVSCSPNVIVYTDVDRDARFNPSVDKKEILLTGFGGFDHDHSLHTVKAGPDGDLYFTTGNTGPHIVTDRSGWTLRAGSSYRGGSPSNDSNVPGLVSDDGRMYVGGLAVRMNIDGTGLRVVGHNFRNPYELCLDSFGNVFQNDNDDTIACRTTWVMEYGNLGFSSNDGKRTWRAGHRPGQTTPTAHWRQDDPGIIPAGDIYGPGSPTGIDYYENGSLGPEFENMLLSAEAGRNTIWSYHPKPQGAGYELRRKSLFSSTNPNSPPVPLDKNDTRKWFRPSDVLVGADGAIYVSDFYDPYIGGHRMLEPDGHGTIYRITRKGDNPQAPALNLDTVDGQIEALNNPASSVRYGGLERLTRQPTVAVVGALLVLSKANNPRFAARAMYALADLGVSVKANRSIRNQARTRVERALAASNEELRITAYRALRKHDPKGLLKRAKKLAADLSPAVRREVALSIRDVSARDSKDIILRLIDNYVENDRWYLEALGIACEGKEATVWKTLLNKATSDPLNWSAAMVDLTWRLHPEEAVEPLRQRALANSLDPAERRRAIDALAFIATREAGLAVLSVATEGPKDLRSYAAWWIKSRSGNLWNAYGLVERLPLDPQVEADAAEDRRVAQARNQLKGATKLTEELTWLAREMARLPKGAAMILHLAGRNELGEFFYPIVSDEIHNNADVSVRALASRYFPKSTSSAQNLPPIGDIANLSGNPENGRELFFGKAACFTCHLHGETGRDVGPNLTEIGARYSRMALLDSIVNPSAAIAFGYESVIVETVDGNTHSGFIVGDGETVIFKDIAGQIHNLSSEDIRSRSELDQSVMPSGASLGLTARELADLVSFLTGAP